MGMAIPGGSGGPAALVRAHALVRTGVVPDPRPAQDEVPEEVVMTLASSTVSVMLPVTDPDRARQFYSESLGLDYTGTNDEGSPMYSMGGGSTLVLLPRPGGTRSDSTAMSFEVDDVVDEVRHLEARGVTFADYDLPGLTTVDHVCELGSEKAAWFQDPDGNVLCIHQTVTASPSAGPRGTVL
jgi:catechol 2,3-dioxygenase-like lactoylglutathione lyase family enzyme